MISDREQSRPPKAITKRDLKRNTKLLERVIQKIHDPKLLSDINLTIETQIRFTYVDVRFIVRHSGHVTIAETAVEIGGRIEAQIMEDLLDIKGKGIKND